MLPTNVTLANIGTTLLVDFFDVHSGKIGVVIKNNKSVTAAIQSCVWPTLYYGTETWTLTKSPLSKRDASVMSIYRIVLKISWTEKITNEEVLRRMGTGREIVRQLKMRELQYIGHLIGHNTSQL